MKPNNVVFSACSAFALLASPVAFAQDSDAMPIDSPDEKVEIVGEQPTEDVGEVAVDNELVSEGGEIPIEWVQRDGGEVMDPVIYQTSMNGPVSANGPVTAATPEKPVKPESAERIEAPVAQGKSAIVRGQEKGPVAIVKGGRVFLR